MKELYANTLRFLDVNEDFTPELRKSQHTQKVRFETLRKIIGKTPQGLKDRIPKRPRKILSKTIRKYNSKHAGKNETLSRNRQNVKIQN